ncbi:MAG: hypothetical protein KF833_20605 [Verrucomicrobiae bacterium]|nr:hypothetical protein [Verrucomicrobiae bacterium]
MKALIVVLIVLSAVYVFTELVGFYDRTANPSQARTRQVTPESERLTGESLPGLPSYLEGSLAEAQQGGLESLERWLRTWSSHVQDPRLAWIELDYVVLLNLKDHRAARERFHQVRARVPATSPVHDRIVRLQSAYE